MISTCSHLHWTPRPAIRLSGKSCSPTPFPKLHIIRSNASMWMCPISRCLSPPLPTSASEPTHARPSGAYGIKVLEARRRLTSLGLQRFDRLLLRTSGHCNGSMPRRRRGRCNRPSAGVDGQAPILYAEGPAACGRYVLMEDGEITGALHLLRGQRGTWLSIWTDTLQTDCRRSRQLLCFGLKTVQADSLKIPVYVGVSDYHGGLSVVLDELGFAPFTDRAKMVKHILARVREGVPLSIPAMESIGEVVTSPYISRQDSWHQHSSHQSARNEPRHSAYVHNELVGKSENYAGTSTR